MGMILSNLEFSIELIVAEGIFLLGTKHKDCFVLRISMACLIIGVASLLLSYEMLFQLLAPSFQYLIVFRFLFLFCLTVTAIWTCFECQRFHTLFCATGGYLLQHIGFSLIELLKQGWKEAFPQANVSATVQTLVGWILYALIYWAAYSLLLRDIIHNEMGADLWSLLFMAASTLMVTVVLSIFVYNFSTGAAMVCRTLSLFASLMGLFSLTELRKNRHLQNEMELLNQKLALRAEQYMLLKDSIEATNILCHDFKHKIAQLREHHTPSEVDTICELETSIRKYDNIARTGNDALDTILTEKSLICDRAGIHFTYMIDEAALRILKDTDMYALFGNALDNAIEAARQLPDEEQRIITVSAGRRGQFLNIHFYNYFTHPLELVDGLPVTTKPDKQYHGYGIKSIRAILQRYDGEMDISANDNIFDLNIAIPLAQQAK